MKFSKCPKCGGDRLKHINEVFARFDCMDCHQRMDERDYVLWAIKIFGYKLNMMHLFELIFESVNN